MDLVYRSAVGVGDLELDECTIRSARDAHGRAWWQLWTWVRRDDREDEPIFVAVPVNPNGPCEEVGPSGRRTWGLLRISASDWQVSPSVDVVGALRPDGTREPSLWHQTPTIVGVPEGERWIAEGP